MSQIKCKCGNTSKNFKKLKPTDFPNGWEAECCLEEVPKPPKVEEVPIKESKVKEPRKMSRSEQRRKRIQKESKED